MSDEQIDAQTQRTMAQTGRLSQRLASWAAARLARWSAGLARWAADRSRRPVVGRVSERRLQMIAGGDVHAFLLERGQLRPVERSLRQAGLRWAVERRRDGTWVHFEGRDLGHVTHAVRRALDDVTYRLRLDAAPGSWRTILPPPPPPQGVRWRDGIPMPPPPPKPGEMSRRERLATELNERAERRIRELKLTPPPPPARARQRAR